MGGFGRKEMDSGCWASSAAGVVGLPISLHWLFEHLADTQLLLQKIWRAVGHGPAVMIFYCLGSPILYGVE